MAEVTFPPPFTGPDGVADQLRQAGYAVLSPGDVAAWSGCPLQDLQALVADWAHLPPDDFLKDGGRYRRRRHACFEVPRAWERCRTGTNNRWSAPGGMERWFAPMTAETVARPVWTQLLAALAAVSDAVFAAADAPVRWFVEAHQFRIDTTDGIGRPTPEGAHRDGVDLVAVFLVAREGVKGGETRVFEAAGPAGQRFTLSAPWSLLLLDDARMIHETTPIQPLVAGGYRDTLVVTCRRESFQGADVAAQRGTDRAGNTP
jgi:hypothetical protein